jgi:integrase
VAQLVNRLDPAAVFTLPEGQYPDGGGLYLLVTKKQRSYFVRYWVADTSPNARRRQKPVKRGLGAVKDITLAEARKAAKRIRTDAERGVHTEGVMAKVARLRVTPTFWEHVRDDALPHFTADFKGGKGSTAYAKWEMTLRVYCAPIRHLKISEIATDNIVAVLEPIWREIPTTAGELQNRLERILDRAIANNLHPGPNPARWDKHIEHLMRSQPTTTIIERARKSMPYADVPGFLRALDAKTSLSARALKFVILTGPREREAGEVEWDEFDLTNKVWTVRDKAMKNGMPATVPLTEPVIALLEEIRNYDLSDRWVFPGMKKDQPISDGTLLGYLKRSMGKPYTVHGFRSSLTSWGQDQTAYDHTLLQHVIHHLEGDESKLAYFRGDALEKRRAVLTDRANFCLDNGAFRPKLFADQAAAS